MAKQPPKNRKDIQEAVTEAETLLEEYHSTPALQLERLLLGFTEVITEQAAQQQQQQPQQQQQADPTDETQKIQQKIANIPGIEQLMGQINSSAELQKVLTGIVEASAEKLEKADVKTALQKMIKAVS